MPIRWDHSNDHLLLVKILETTPNIKVDAASIAEAWPTTTGEDKPTPRAIRERLNKIRTTTNANISIGNGFSSASSGSGGKGRKGVKASGINGVNPTNGRAAPVPVGADSTKKTETTAMKTEDDETVTVIKSDNDADDEKDFNPLTPTSNGKAHQRVKPPHALGLGITASPAGLLTPQTGRKKSTTPAGRKSGRRGLDSDSDSDLPNLMDMIEGSGGAKMKTRGKRVEVYQSDDSQQESEISEFGVEHE